MRAPEPTLNGNRAVLVQHQAERGVILVHPSEAATDTGPAEGAGVDVPGASYSPLCRNP